MEMTQLRDGIWMLGFWFERTAISYMEIPPIVSTTNIYNEFIGYILDHQTMIVSCRPRVNPVLSKDPEPDIHVLRFFAAPYHIYPYMS